ncbi:expressed unknown protein [Seminavis robusta]|uniref:Fe2OG dioxygenase domain-containing protein n=1 Tax=Seminavis robusta TaxID=568900 RepID=A0A9N8E5R4_9STRA|nr:expressed unknown protein [Seminavis robusta]|eukprot:Sro699_g189540.1 n/a (648) ;mRNA; f:48738-50681
MKLLVCLLLVFPSLFASVAFAWTCCCCLPQRRQNPLASATSRLAVTDPSSSTEKSLQEDDPSIIIHRSKFLGDIYRIRLGDDDDFLGANAVPTFASRKKETSEEEHANRSSSHDTTLQSRGLEGAIAQGPAFVLDNVLSQDVCEELIDTFENQLGFGNYQAGKNFHGALQIVVPPEVTQPLGQVLSRHVDIRQVEARRTEMLQATTHHGSDNDNTETHDVRIVFAGLNRRWRVYRYAPGGEETFAPHIDAGFPPSGLTEDGTNLIWDDSASYIDDEESSSTIESEIVSRLTILMYLNEDFVGGETKFYDPQQSSSVIAAVKPVAGSCLVFPQGVGPEAVDYARQHWPLHEGSPVQSGNRPKYVIRSDILFSTTREPLLLDNPLWRNDHWVRHTFLPTSQLVDATFLSHVQSLYNPHMGVENIASLLYGWIRFTKKQRICEIGAGYTTLWILQALKDNQDEMTRIRQLEQDGKCTLLDIPWTVPPPPLDDKEQPSLLCIDNCAHQKETATGAVAVAKALGLDPYLQFLKGDAFEMGDLLEEASIDMLWCDFGVGSRMKEFLSQGAWASLRPGGFLLCHSTLTNQRTRDWLEAARARKGEEVTGIPPEEYVEISLLEPHKRYQNSVSIFQKRKQGEEAVYSEPIFSEYA